MALKVFVCLALACSGLFAASDGRVAVIVELFTSEGCSSCPPADAVLARLQRLQPVENARIIALSEHVDYWNNLGWVDPFSSSQFRARQNDYAQAFGVDSIYTPQMVVNGLVQFVGSDMNEAMTQIHRVALQPAANVQVHAVQDSKQHDVMGLVVHVGDVPRLRTSNKSKTQPLDIMLAVTEDNVQSQVQRGENAGRRLRHVAVVRSFGLIGSIDPRENTEVSMRPTLKLPPAWKREDLHAVVFVQERATRRILGADTVDLN